MRRPKKPRLPTYHQAQLLQRLAITGQLMLTHNEDKKDRYTDGAGGTIDERTAKIFIREGWVIAERDSMFDLTPQSWKVRTAMADSKGSYVRLR
jgi:hypothetical protein